MIDGSEKRKLIVGSEEKKHNTELRVLHYNQLVWQKGKPHTHYSQTWSRVPLNNKLANLLMEI